MTYPTENPEVTAIESGLVNLLKPITYLDPTHGGGDVFGTREPVDGIVFNNYTAPAIVVAFTGTMLGDQQTATIGGCVFEEEFHFALFLVNANFDRSGSGRLEGQVAGDVGSYPLITDARLSVYGKTFFVVSPWPNAGPGARQVKIFPAQPPVQKWDIVPKENPNLIVHRMNVRATWLINA